LEKERAEEGEDPDSSYVIRHSKKTSKVIQRLILTQFDDEANNSYKEVIKSYSKEHVPILD
jgi:hypothetical protein